MGGNVRDREGRRLHSCARRAVTAAAIVSLLVGRASAAPPDPCAKIKQALAGGKTADQVAKEMKLPVARVTACTAPTPTPARVPAPAAAPAPAPAPAAGAAPPDPCAKIKQALAGGKTADQVAKQMKVPVARVTACAAAAPVPPPAPKLPLTDVDDDKKSDAVKLEKRGSDVFLVAELTRLGRQEVKVVGAEPRKPEEGAPPIHDPRVLGFVDVDHDHLGEVFVEIEPDSPTASFTIFRVVNGRLVQMTLDGDPVKLPLDDSLTHVAAIGCGTGKLVTVSWGGFDCGKQMCFDGERVVYALDGPALSMVGHSTHEFGPCDDPRLGCPRPAALKAAGYAVSCHPVPFN